MGPQLSFRVRFSLKAEVEFCPSLLPARSPCVLREMLQADQHLCLIQRDALKRLREGKVTVVLWQEGRG